MAKLNEEAKAYEAPKTKNIADLDIVQTDLEVLECVDVEFPYKYVEVQGERYRVPISVLKALKAILEEKPNLKFFKVKKEGEGMKTEYVVIPIE